MRKNKKTKKPTKKNKSKKKKKQIIVAVSGGFDPIHIGHIRLMQEAKKLGDKLVVILNNDNWFSIKGRELFMPEEERREIIKALSCVDEVVLTNHERSGQIFDRTTKEYSVCRELEEIRPDIFANGGDRFADDVPEFKLCNELGIKMVFNVGEGGKVRSSSDLLKDYSKRLKNK